MNEEELLLHFGVKGMKWGVRRARNSVGSVTRSFKNAHDKADAAKNAKVAASKSYKEAQKNKKSEARRKATSDKVKDGINTKLSNKTEFKSAAIDTALSMGIGVVVANSLGYRPIVGAGVGLGIDYLLTESKKG